jgi:hypothetical protein
MFDGTAPEALEQLASALHSYLSNPAERWFELQVEGEGKLEHDALDWLDEVSELIYSSYRRADVGLNMALHECYMDIGSFGTLCLFQGWSNKTGDLTFSSKPLQTAYFLEDNEGRVDTVMFEVTWTIRQCIQEFGQMLPPKLMEYGKKDQDRPVQMAHFAFPRTDRLPRKLDARNKRVASVWICLTTKELVGESGYDTLPYHVARWVKLSGEAYGRGPAKKCLADVKMLNAMERTLLKAGQKQVDPPLVLGHEGFMLPIRTSPGSLIFKEEEERKIEALRFEGNLPWGEDKAAQKRAFIEKCFYADWIRMEKENVEMTAYEVADRRDEKLRLLAPIFGRITSELHGPMVARSYFLLNEHGRIPQAPPSLEGRRLKVGYISPAAVAQLGARANQMSRLINDLTPVAQIRPDVMDALDLDEVAQEMAKARRVPRNTIRSPKDVEQIRAERAQQQQTQQLMQVAEPASKAVKNLADAEAKTGGGLAGGSLL